VQAALAGQGEELGVRNNSGKEAPHLPEHQALIVVLEALEARKVIEHQDGEHLALGKRGPAAGRMLLQEPLGQRVVGEVVFDFLAEIVNKAEHFHHFTSIYDKVHKARELGETIEQLFLPAP